MLFGRIHQAVQYQRRDIWLNWWRTSRCLSTSQPQCAWFLTWYHVNLSQTTYVVCLRTRRPFLDLSSIWTYGRTMRTFTRLTPSRWAMSEERLGFQGTRASLVKRSCSYFSWWSFEERQFSEGAAIHKFTVIFSFGIFSSAQYSKHVIFAFTWYKFELLSWLLYVCGTRYQKWENGSRLNRRMRYKRPIPSAESPENQLEDLQKTHSLPKLLFIPNLHLPTWFNLQRRW